MFLCLIDGSKPPVACIFIEDSDLTTELFNFTSGSSTPGNRSYSDLVVTWIYIHCSSYSSIVQRLPV